MDAALRKDGTFDQLDAVAQGVVYREKAIEIMKQHPLGTVRYCLIGAMPHLGRHGHGNDSLILVHPHNQETGPQGSDTAITGVGTYHLLRTHPLLFPIQFLYMLMLFIGYVLIFIGGVWRLVQSGHGTIAAYLFLSASFIFNRLRPSGILPIQNSHASLFGFWHRHAFFKNYGPRDNVLIITPRLAIQKGDFTSVSGVPYWPLEAAIFAFTLA